MLVALADHRPPAVYATISHAPLEYCAACVRLKGEAKRASAPPSSSPAFKMHNWEAG
jgi:hypothetical protein